MEEPKNNNEDIDKVESLPEEINALSDSNKDLFYRMDQAGKDSRLGLQELARAQEGLQGDINRFEQRADDSDADKIRDLKEKQVMGKYLLDKYLYKISK